MSTSTLTYRELWGQWIDQRYIAEETMGGARVWHASRPDRPLVLPGFLRPERAAQLAAVVRSISFWQHVFTVMEPDGSVRDVTNADWASAPEEVRWNHQEIARPFEAFIDPQGPLSVSQRDVIREFFTFAFVGPSFRSWLGSILGVELQQKVSCEVVRYQPTDYLPEHSDTHDDRIVGVNLYLGAGWAEGDGGELGFRNESGAVSTVAPLFNGLSILPIREGCVHWVEPWRRGQPGRETISLSYRPIAAAPQDGAGS